MDTQLVETFFAVVMLSFVIERALAVLFELPKVDRLIYVVPNPDDTDRPRSIKGYIAAAVSISICLIAGFDLPGEIFRLAGDALAHPTALSGAPGEMLTGLVVAGGSQASVKLFQDVLGVSRERRDHIKQLREEQLAADIAEAASRTKQFTNAGSATTSGLLSLPARDRLGHSMRSAGDADARRRIDAAERRIHVDDKKIRLAALVRERLRADRRAREATLRVR